MGLLKNVLIIDDDDIHNYLFSKRIRNIGLSDQVNIAKGVDTALLYIKGLLNENSPLPEVIFLDLQMPGLNGWDFIKKYEKLVPKEQLEKVVVFMLSSSIHPLDIQKAERHPLVMEYIKKPLMEDELFVLKARYFKEKSISYS